MPRGFQQLAHIEEVERYKPTALDALDLKRIGVFTVWASVSATVR